MLVGAHFHSCVLSVCPDELPDHPAAPAEVLGGGPKPAADATPPRLRPAICWFTCEHRKAAFTSSPCFFSHRYILFTASLCHQRQPLLEVDTVRLGSVITILSTFHPCEKQSEPWGKSRRPHNAFSWPPFPSMC